MTLPKPIRWLFKTVAGVLGLLLVLLLLVSFIRIPINLEGQKGMIEFLASRQINRQVNINGAIHVTTSLWPVFIIEDVRVNNPKNFGDGDFARLESTRLELSLIRLLLMRLRIRQFTLKGLNLSLQANENGEVNWVFGNSDLEPEDKPQEKVPPTEEQQLWQQLTSDALIVDKLSLSDISVFYYQQDMEKPHEFKIDSCSGSALPGEAFQLNLQGTTLEEPYEVLIRTASLQELLEENRSWIDIEANIAKANFIFSGDIDLAEINRRLNLNLSINGQGLDNFNHMLKLDLPPFPSYGLSASLALMKGKAEMTDLKLRISNSELTGHMLVDNTGSIPQATLTLHSPTFQIDDFVFDDWSLIPDIEEEIEVSDKATIAKADEEIIDTPGSEQQSENERILLSPGFLKTINASITVSADKVLSGEDQLGSGKITATLKDGRISLDPLNLNIPGGSVSMNMSVKPGKESSEASLRVLVQEFDFGVLARRADPETNMGGVVNIDVDFKSSAKGFLELLDHGNGYLDFSAKPENLQSGIMDLWAVNVITAIVSQSVKGQSHIEYVVGRWSLKDGYLQPDVFVIDTTRMRICGKGWVDFKTDKLNLEVAPAPKKPEFFSLATPISVQGDFTNFGLVVAPGGIIGTGVKFIISPIQVPLQTMFDNPIPADGNDLWNIELGPGNRDMKRPVGCRWFSTGKGVRE